MKKDLHPKEYRTVVIQDTSNGDTFLTRSTAPTDETIKWEDGNDYPLVKVHISSTSHPFYTGKEKLVDIEGRVDKFKARREAGAKRREALKKKTKKTPAKQAKIEPKTLKMGVNSDRPKPGKPKSVKPQTDEQVVKGKTETKKPATEKPVATKAKES